MHYGDDRQAGRRHAGQVVEHAAAPDEFVHPVLAQVGAGRFHQMDEGQLVLQGNLLATHELLVARFGQRTGVDP
ncbi:hypothetical protein D3C71_1802150 [compost metagenome]